LRYSHFAEQPRFLLQLLTFIGLITSATVIYLLLAWMFRCPEIEEVYGIALRRDQGPALPPGME